jgi:preprotein translocase subunit SecE
MARDRQRAKQRRQRQAGARQRTTRDVEREIGLGSSDDAVETPLGEGTGAPDPLRHSSAEVDEARLAEAGAIPPEVGDPGDVEAEIYDDELDDAERAPDAVEGDAVIARPAHYVEHERARRRRGRLLTFLGHCIDELRRVQWPNRRHVGQATAVVLGFVVIAGGYLGLLDAIWQPLINAIL